MKRTGFNPRQQTLSQRAALKKVRKPNPMKAGSLGARLVPKDEDPIFDKDHLALVREQPCIVRQLPGCIAHHPRGLFSNRTMGRRITDFLALPLAPDLHDGYGHSLHRHGNEEVWWNYSALLTKADIFKWLRKFLLDHYPIDHPGVVQAFVKMDQEESRQ